MDKQKYSEEGLFSVKKNAVLRQSGLVLGKY